MVLTQVPFWFRKESYSHHYPELISNYLPSVQGGTMSEVLKETFPANPLLSPQAVAKQLDVKLDYVYRLAREGKIPCVRFGRMIRFRAHSVEKWIREHEQSSLSH